MPVMAETSSGVWKFYGFSAREEINTPEGREVIAELDMLALMHGGDPPFFVSNDMKGGMPPENRGHLLHHPLHAKGLKDRAGEVGVHALVFAPGIGIEPSKEKKETLETLFVRILKEGF